MLSRTRVVEEWRERQRRSSRRWEWRRKWKRQVWLLLLQDAPTALEARPWRVMQARRRWIEKFARSGPVGGNVKLDRTGQGWDRSEGRMRRTVDQGVLFYCRLLLVVRCACPLLSCPVGHERRETGGGSGLEHFQDAIAVTRISVKPGVEAAGVPESKLSRDVTSKTQTRAGL